MFVFVLYKRLCETRADAADPKKRRRATPTQRQTKKNAEATATATAA